MKKIAKSLILVTVLALLGSTMYGQYFKEKDKVVNVGIGLGSTLYASGYGVHFPPLSASFEYGVKDGVGPGSIGVGGYLGFTSAQSDYWRTTYTVIGVRGAYHLVDIADKLDLYGGLMLQYNIVSNSYRGPNNINYAGSSVGSGGDFSLFVGARYYVTDKFALMAELGYGVAVLNLGVAFKL
jgi:hypothetical protein